MDMTDIPFYRLRTGKKLFSLGDKILDIPILGTSLGDYQESIIVEILGLELIDISDVQYITHEQYYLFNEDIFFTKEFIRKVISSPKGKSIRFCLNENEFNRTYVFDHSTDATENLKFEFYFKRAEDSSDKVENHYLDQRPFDQYFSVPKQIDPKGEKYFGQCDLFASTIISPFHLLYTNIALNLGRTIGVQKILPNWFIKKFIPVGGWLYYKSLKRLNKIGKNCLIHPSAIIEGCVIGDNVKIGANCVVRLSTLGSNTTLEENVTLTYSILGPGCYIANGNVVNFCMCYENVFLIHGPYQFSLYGKNVGVMAVINCDFRLDQKSIKFMSSKGLIDSKQGLLGICYGHNTVVGGGNIIAPGRIVPNNLKIAPPANIIISKFDHLME